MAKTLLTQEKGGVMTFNEQNAIYERSCERRRSLNQEEWEKEEQEEDA
jgi:hypothetical protein